MRLRRIEFGSVVLPFRNVSDELADKKDKNKNAVRMPEFADVEGRATSLRGGTASKPNMDAVLANSVAVGGFPRFFTRSVFVVDDEERANSKKKVSGHV